MVAELSCQGLLLFKQFALLCNPCASYRPSEMKWGHSLTGPALVLKATSSRQSTIYSHSYTHLFRGPLDLPTPRPAFNYIIRYGAYKAFQDRLVCAKGAQEHLALGLVGNRPYFPRGNQPHQHRRGSKAT